MTDRPSKKPRVDAHLTFSGAGVWLLYVCDWEQSADKATGWKPVFHNAPVLDPKPGPVPTRRQRTDALAAVGWELVNPDDPDPWNWCEAWVGVDDSPLVYACAEVRPVPGWEAPPD